VRESPIEQSLRTAVEKQKGRAYKWTSPGNKGVPDRIVFMHGMCFLVETKATNGRLSAVQKVQHKKLKALGFDVVVLNSKEQVKLWVELQSSILKRMAIDPELARFM
jgi:hypothetical protein